MSNDKINNQVRRVHAAIEANLKEWEYNKPFDTDKHKESSLRKGCLEQHKHLLEMVDDLEGDYLIEGLDALAEITKPESLID